MNRIIAALASCLLASTALSATLEVPGDYATIQGAIDAAVDGDVINIASGEYAVSGTVADLQGKAITLRGASGPADDPTILRNTNSTAATVVISESEGGEATLEHLTIRRGNPGILCESSSPTIRNCTIEQCEGRYRGGGMNLLNSSAEIVDCIITDNTHTWNNSYSAGIYISGGSPTFSDCSFTDNAGKRGGAAHVYNATATFDGCLFEGNSANTYISGKDEVSGAGGAFYMSSQSICILNDCVIRGNEATLGSKTAARAAGIYAISTATVTLERCIIDDNACDISDGAGILTSSSSFSMTDCIISNNTAYESTGAGIQLNSGADCEVVRCKFFGNAAYNGGAISVRNNASLTLSDSIVRQNSGSQWSGPGVGGLTISDGGEAIISGTTFCENTVENEISGEWTDAGDNEFPATCPAVTGACCIGDTCLYIDGASCDVSGGLYFGDNSLCDPWWACSNCPEGELPDCNGNCFPADWIGDSICDDGAYDHNGVLIYLDCDHYECDGGDCICECPGDYDGDNDIDVSDLLTVIGSWDDPYDVSDLLLVISEWGNDCP
jgi:parallel beta-helix repeat protein